MKLQGRHSVQPSSRSESDCALIIRTAGAGGAGAEAKSSVTLQSPAGQGVTMINRQRWYYLRTKSVEYVPLLGQSHAV
jgi:hypothetical protein